MKQYRCAIDGIIRQGFPTGDIPSDNLKISVGGQRLCGGLDRVSRLSIPIDHIIGDNREGTFGGRIVEGIEIEHGRVNIFL